MATIEWGTSSGNWSGTANWIGSVVPTSADDVLFGTASGAVMGTIDTNVSCRSWTATDFTGTIVHNAACTVTIGDGTAGAGSVALAF
jgi:hypothetical protein